MSNQLLKFRDLIRERYPDHASDPRIADHASAHLFCDFLNEHFPIAGGWNTQPVEHGVRMFNEHYPKP